QRRRLGGVLLLVLRPARLQAAAHRVQPGGDPLAVAGAAARAAGRLRRVRGGGPGAEHRFRGHLDPLADPDDRGRGADLSPLLPGPAGHGDRPVRALLRLDRGRALVAALVRRAGQGVPRAHALLRRRPGALGELLTIRLSPPSPRALAALTTLRAPRGRYAG